MGMIRNHLHQMKVEQPSEYKRLMEDYATEDELIKEVCGLSIKAINSYYFQNKTLTKGRKR